MARILLAPNNAGLHTSTGCKTAAVKITLSRLAGYRSLIRAKSHDVTAFVLSYSAVLEIYCKIILFFLSVFFTFSFVPDNLVYAANERTRMIDSKLDFSRFLAAFS
jgi:hypothetical protein